jgi:thiamine-phosphate pyrophosphorylase
MAMRTQQLPRLMLVTDRNGTRGRDLVEVVAAAARGGVGLVQIRERDLSDDALRELVLRIREVVPEGTQLLVNSSVRVARTLRVGLHLPAGASLLGETDLGGQPYGRSVHDEDELKIALDDGADFLVLGTIYPTPCKPGHPGAGLQLVQRICREVRPLPVFAIGGVEVGRIPDLIHAGAHGVAVSSGLLAANDPTRIAEAMNLAIEVALRAG